MDIVKRIPSPATRRRLPRGTKLIGRRNISNLLSPISYLLSAALCAAAASAFAYEARTVAITDTHMADGLATSFDLAFGAGQATNALYMAYGTFDGGADPKAWQNLVKVADILPGTSAYTAAVPAGWGTGVKALRFFMADVADIPYDAALEYIYTTGYEYADTGYLPTSDTSVAIDMAYVGSAGTSGNSWVPIWGYRRTSNVDAFALFINQNATKFALNFKNTDVKVNAGINVGERFIYRNDNARQYVTRVERNESEVLLGENVADLDFQAVEGWTLAFNGFRTGLGSIEVRSLRMRVYGMKIWEGGDLMRDYVPCRIGALVGLYDNVTKTLLSASSDCAFAAGPVRVENGGFGAVAAAPASVFASGAAPVGTATREVSITATNRLAGAIVSFDLSFSPSYATNYLYLASGAMDGGDDPADWENLEFVKVVVPFEDGATVPVPAGWGDDVLALRFFLGAPPSKPYDDDIEWLATTGSQWFDTGFHFLYGQTFTFIWRQFTLANLNDRDYGWRAGPSGNAAGPAAICGGGSRESNAIKTYFSNSWRPLSPAFPVSALLTETVFRDEAVVGDTFDFTMTDVATGDAWTIAATGLAPQSGTSYDSGANIFLCSSGLRSDIKPGKKAVYRATLSDTATGDSLFDLVPVVKDGVPCLYDLVSGNLVMNAGAGDALAGPKVAPRLVSTSFGAMTETLSIADLPRVAATSVSPIAGSYTSVTVSYDVRSLGGAAAVDVDLNYGPSADAMSITERIATGTGLGAGSCVLAGLTAGRTYYAQLVASSNGASGEPSATFSFTVPAPESPAGGSGRPFTGISAVGSTATATFVANSLPTVLYAAYGSEYGGETTNGWETVVKVGDIAADATTATFTLPAGWGTSIKYMRCFLVVSPPEGVTLFDKLTTSNGPYINTGLYPDRDLVAEARVAVLAQGGSGNKPVFGERKTSNWDFNFVCWVPQYTDATCAPNIGHKQYDNGMRATGKAYGELATYTMGLSVGLVVDGVVVGPPSEFAAYDTDAVSCQPLYLFALLSDGSLDNRLLTCDFHYFKAWHGDALVQYLVPCESNGAVATLDVVTGAIFGNARNTGSFIAGNPVVTNFTTFSDYVIAPDAMAPALGEIAASGEWRGDRVTVSGIVTSAGAGDCVIVVETSRLGDFTDAVSWSAPGTYGAGETFAVELYEADTASVRYIRPGATLWYRVKVTDRAGMLDATVPASVTTAAAMSVGNLTIASSGAAFTVTAPVTTVGANTNWAWVVHSVGNAFLDHATDKVAIPHDYDGATFDVSGLADAAAPGTLHWALVISNDCSTAVWVTTTATAAKSLVNNLRYTWKKSVAAGNWEDAANWDGPAGRFSWPSADSEAAFPNSATASVTIASALVEVVGLYLDQPDLDVTFSGGRDRKLKVSSALRTNAAGGTICISNLSFEVSNGGFDIGEGRTMVFHDAFAEIFNGAEFGARGGPDRHLLISGGTTVRSSGRISVGGEGSTVVIDDSYVDLYAASHGFFPAAGADGGEFIFKGRNARLEAVSSARNASKRKNGAIVFVIPEGGYAATPVKQVTDRHNGTSWSLANLFADDAGNPSVIYPLTIRIDPDSPALRSRTSLTQPLVEWKSGINLEKALRAPLEKPNRNFFVYSGEFDGHDDWTADWTDTGNAPLALGFRRESGATVIMLR